MWKLELSSFHLTPFHHHKCIKTLQIITWVFLKPRYWKIGGKIKSIREKHMGEISFGSEANCSTLFFARTKLEQILNLVNLWRILCLECRYPTPKCTTNFFLNYFSPESRFSATTWFFVRKTNKYSPSLMYANVIWCHMYKLACVWSKW